MFSWILATLATFVLFTLIIYALKLQQAIRATPQVAVPAGGLSNPSFQSMPRLSVIIPAYNEAENVEDCLRSVLSSSSRPPEQLEVWLVDDQSTDETGAIARSLQQTLHDPRLKVIAGAPRPNGEVWVGKNWACTQAASQATGDFLLFLDADVRLRPGALEVAVHMADDQGIDLLSYGPAIECGCLAEWLVQPLMFSLIIIGFDYRAVNDPQNDTAFAAGPFMLFRRIAYDTIGGHRTVAAEIVEDVELSRLIKQKGLRLTFVSGSEWASVRMYRSFAALWEGWTKNIYLGSQRNLSGTLVAALLVLLICTMPWLSLLLLLGKGLCFSFNGLDWGAIALSLAGIAIHYHLRCICAQETKIPPKYWWLTGVGGLVVAAMMVASIIKTETGWGWTWRGRSLRQALRSG
ncbi:MAG TPA: glycosyltransferase [Synechococcales cyanobacterium M55_K2018_004]|nr:glycosyltransferase [Synechococcales cyanobacterium M55_K2018_004]